MNPTTTVNLQEILTHAGLSEEPLVLYGMSWDDYSELLDLTEGQNYPKLTYYNGVLKIMGKHGFLHENISRFLYDLVRIVSLVLKVKVISSGSMTLLAKKIGKGAEPDESFYIQNAACFPLKKTLFDYEADTPPDLVIEVDESSKSGEKFTIYAEFGIREFWRYDKNELKIYGLDELGNYREIINSIAFPILSTQILNEYLTRREQDDQFEALLDFEKWLRLQTENN